METANLLKLELLQAPLQQRHREGAEDGQGPLHFGLQEAADIEEHAEDPTHGERVPRSYGRPLHPVPQGTVLLLGDP